MNPHPSVILGALAPMLSMLIASPCASAGETAGSSVAAWVDSLPFDPRVMDNIELFAGGKRDAFGDRYAVGLFAGVRSLVGADAERRLNELSEGVRRPFIEVTILEPGFAFAGENRPQNETEREFEKSFVRTEVVVFFENEGTSPGTALRLYTGAEFRKSVSSRIERVWEEEGEVCVEIRGVKLLLDPLAYCDRVEDLHAEGLSVQHTLAVRNAGGDGYQTMFFKESLKTFVRLPDGLAFHYINYSRTIGMGAVQRRIARGKIEDSERNAVEELARRLASRPETTDE